MFIDCRIPLIGEITPKVTAWIISILSQIIAKK